MLKDKKTQYRPDIDCAADYLVRDVHLERLFLECLGLFRHRLDHQASAPHMVALGRDPVLPDLLAAELRVPFYTLVGTRLQLEPAQ